MIIRPFLSVKGLRTAGLAYAGKLDPDSFVLSPINGELEDVRNISIFVGSRDILSAYTRKLKALLTKKGIFINNGKYLIIDKNTAANRSKISP